MIVDLAEVGSGIELNTDICIVGAGAAGISIARRLAGSGIGVCLVESGGMAPDAPTQALYQAENVGLPRAPHDASRLRYFGGTTNHWTGHCAPFVSDDFAARPWVPSSGWPVSRAELTPYYADAYRVCQLDGAPLEKGIAAFADKVVPGLDRGSLDHYFLQYSPPTRFGAAYGPGLGRAANIQILLHANVTDIFANAAARAVDSVECRALNGRTGRISARHVVLSCGGIENARLLLSSRGSMNAGLGNQHDLVGRYFMDHPFGRIGFLQSTGRLGLRDRLGEHEIGSRQYRFGLALSADLQKRQETLGCGIQFWPSSLGALAAMDENAGSDGLIDRVMTAFNRRWQGFKRDMEDDGGGDVALFELFAVAEQEPNPMSRVTLSRERDALGLNRARIDWRLTPLDRRTREVAVRTVAAELGRLDAGRVRVAPWLEQGDGLSDNVEDYNHHMGTTRMADDPKQGVVNRHCRVHGLANLYVAGSSVFPTSGFVNPTLTIVALALRLADHLKTRVH